MSGLELTVVMATKNRPDLALRMCRSLLRARGVDLEVVIVDDGSSCVAASVLAAFAAASDRVRLPRNETSVGPSRVDGGPPSSTTTTSWAPTSTAR